MCCYVFATHHQQQTFQLSSYLFVFSHRGVYLWNWRHSRSHFARSFCSFGGADFLSLVNCDFIDFMYFHFQNWRKNPNTDILRYKQCPTKSVWYVIWEVTILRAHSHASSYKGVVIFGLWSKCVLSNLQLYWHASIKLPAVLNSQWCREAAEACWVYGASKV